MNHLKNIIIFLRYSIGIIIMTIAITIQLIALVIAFLGEGLHWLSDKIVGREWL